MGEAFAATARNDMLRKAARAAHGRATLYGIVDAALVGRAGDVIAGLPSVNPPLPARDGDAVLL